MRWNHERSTISGQPVPKKRGSTYQKGLKSRVSGPDNKPAGSGTRDAVMRRGRPFIERSRRQRLLADLERDGRRVEREVVEKSGPYMLVEEAAKELGVSSEEVMERIDSGTLIGIEAPYFSHVQVPRWQINDGEVLQGLEQVLVELGAEAISEALLFFNAPSPQNGGRTPIELLRDGHLIDVLDLARSHREQGGR